MRINNNQPYITIMNNNQPYKIIIGMFSSPKTFLTAPKGELYLEGFSSDADRLKLLPLALKGKAVYFADTLRNLPTWTEAKAASIKEFTIDPLYWASLEH